MNDLSIEVSDLRTLASGLDVDSDYLLARVTEGDLLLLNYRPQAAAFPDEQHVVSERIVVLAGRVALETAQQRVEMAAGQMACIPPGLSHHYAADSDGQVQVLFG